MTEKRFMINKNMSLDNKIETYELSCLVDNENKTFYFIVDSIANVESFVKRLNELHEENQDLKSFNQDLAENLSVCANARISKDNRIERLEEKIQRERTSFTKTHERWSKEAETKIKELSEENEVCKEAYNEIKSDAIRLNNKNEQLQARNDRQAKQLDNLYRLIEQKDWESLTEIIDDFKRCEEQLQREWRTYE